MTGALNRALELIGSGDPELYRIIATSLKFAGASALLAACLGVPLGILLAVRRFPGRRGVLVVLNSLMALPTVVVGLFVYSVVSRSGALGYLGLLFNPPAVILGQTLLSWPIVASMTASSLSQIESGLSETLTLLGAKTHSRLWMFIREGRTGIIAAVLGGFGRVIGEVGVSMMLGGNIKGHTRTITTAIALETSKGEFELALALGLVLILIALGINALIHGMVHHER